MIGDYPPGNTDNGLHCLVFPSSSKQPSLLVFLLITFHQSRLTTFPALSPLTFHAAITRHSRRFRCGGRSGAFCDIKLEPCIDGGLGELFSERNGFVEDLSVLKCATLPLK